LKNFPDFADDTSSLMERVYMDCRKILLLGILASVSACKESGEISQSASVSDAKAATEQCGIVQKKGSEFLLLIQQQFARALAPQDGAVTNILSEYTVSKTEICVRGDWSGTGAVMVTSAASVRLPVRRTIITEECGVLSLSPEGKLTLQIAGNNSEGNVNKVLDPQDGATINLLKDYASTMTEVCVKGDFSDSLSVVTVNSQSAVRKAK
jgi:hypothetical protein